MQEQFADDSYHGVVGLCNVASVADIVKPRAGA
jgi:hypothetical protein